MQTLKEFLLRYPEESGRLENCKLPAECSINILRNQTTFLPIFLLYLRLLSVGPTICLALITGSYKYACDKNVMELSAVDSTLDVHSQNEVQIEN